MKAIYLNHTYLKLRNMGQTVVNFRRWMGQYVQDYECGSQLPSCIRNLWMVRHTIMDILHFSAHKRTYIWLKSEKMNYLCGEISCLEKKLSIASPMKINGRIEMFCLLGLKSQ